MDQSAPKTPKFASLPQKKFSLHFDAANWTKILPIIFFGIFFYWLITTLIPITVVEAKYQYQHTLQTWFHVDSLSEIILPNFDALNLQESSKYKNYGIKIPAVFIDEPVIFNVDPNDKTAYSAALKRGIAHASGTSFPDNGGIGYYFAHSSSSNLHLQYNAVFYLLGKLETGDEIYIWHEGKKYTYKVTESRITDPKDISFLHDFYSTETIVLQTCWPPGSTSKRLLVFGERVD